MRFSAVCGLLAVVLLASPVFVRAAAPQPGRLADAAEARRPSVLNPVLEPSTNEPRVSVVTIDDSRPDTVQRVWIVSICAVIAASALDAASSWGKQEGNPLLASSNGNFGARGLAIKAGIAGAVIAPQIILRKHKHLRIGFTVANFTDAAVFTAVSVHNMGVSGD